MASYRYQDPTINPFIRKVVAETAIQLMNDFCRMADRMTIRKLEEAFSDSVQNYMANAMLGQDKRAQEYLKQAHGIIGRARELGGRHGDQADSSPE